MTIPVKGKSIEFQALREAWSMYIIRDKSPVQLKARIILTKVLKADSYNALGEPIYATGTATPIIVTVAPPELTGPPTLPPPTQDAFSRVELTELEFERVEEPWNEYKLTDGTVVRIRVLLTGIRRSPFFGLDGDPLYTVTSDVSTHISVPTELRQKLESKSQQRYTV
jgi:hypothetical protein